MLLWPQPFAEFPEANSDNEGLYQHHESQQSKYGYDNKSHESSEKNGKKRKCNGEVGIGGLLFREKYIISHSFQLT